MTSQCSVETVGETDAPVDLVWPMVSDARRYAAWGPWDASGYESSDVEESHGVGAIRWMTVGRTRTVERIVALDPGHRLAYTVLRGIPVRNYRAEVVLDATDHGTRIRWSAAWDRTVLGRIVHRRLVTFYPDMLDRLVAAADQQVAAGGGGR